MFKKLKDKITEEISPQNFQRLTQSVTEKLQGSTTSEENFFSIAEDDSSVNMEGFSNVSLSPQEARARRHSNSSMASDISFLPRYESVASMYHLQSDLDISASELEDNASSSSSLGHLSKEQIYSAFQKSQMRYHKYRGRYTDLAKHYRELEREVSKMKAVLVETQDKAIRRVAELKEQCTLEQNAKAHLESALRDDLDEKQLKIESLQTKNQLLQNGAVDGENIDNLTRYLNEARQEIEQLNGRLQEMKANSIVFQSKEQEYKNKIANFEKELVLVSEREKENNLILAQNKMDLHNEIVGKDGEIANLKQDVDVLKQSLEDFETGKKLENLQTQNGKLIEKIESLDQKCKVSESELLKMEQFRSENEKLKLSLKEHANEVEDVRKEAKKCIVDLEESLRNSIREEFLLKEQLMKQEFKKDDSELFEKNEELVRIRKENEQFSAKLSKFADLERNHLELIEESARARQLNLKLEEQIAHLSSLKLENNREIGQLQSELQGLKQEIADLHEIEQSNFVHSQNEKVLGEQVRLFEEKNEAVDLENTESRLLEMKLQKLEAEKNALWESFQKEQKIFEETLKDNSKLKASDEKIGILEEKLTNLTKELTSLHSNYQLKETEFEELSHEKTELDEIVRNLKQRVKIFEEKDEAIDLENTESKILEMKLQKMEEEKQALWESYQNEQRMFADLLKDHSELKESEHKVRILEETVNSLSQELSSVNINYQQQETEFKDLTNEKSEQDGILRKLKEQVRIFEERQEAIEMENTESQLLELKLTKMNHEKEILTRDQQRFENLLIANEEMVKKLEQNNNELNERNNTLTKEKEEILENSQKSLEFSKQEYQTLENKLTTLEEETLTLKSTKQELENEITTLQNQLQDTNVQNENFKTQQKSLESSKQKYQILENKLSTFEEETLTLKSTKEELENEITTLQQQLQATNVEKENLKTQQKSLESSKQEYQTLENKLSTLEKETLILKSTKQELENEITTLQNQLQATNLENENLKTQQNSLEVTKQQYQALENKLTTLEEETQTLKSTKQELTNQITTLENQLQATNLENENLKTQQNSLEVTKQQYQALENKLTTLEDETHTLKSTKQELTNQITTLENQLQATNVENEKLKTQQKSLEFTKQEYQTLENKLTTLQEETLALKSTKEELEKEITTIHNQIQTTNHENEKLKTQLHEYQQRIAELTLYETKSKTLQEENQNSLLEITKLKENIAAITQERNSLTDNLTARQTINEQNDTLKVTVSELESRNVQIQTDNKYLTEENHSLTSEIDELRLDNLKNSALQSERDKLKSALCELQTQYNDTSDIRQQLVELERQLEEVLREKQLLLDEIEELKTMPLNHHNHSVEKNDKHNQEIEGLRDKLTQYKSLDLTNRSSIEFYENELEKLKKNNDKLNRKLDETLVTLNHCTELSSSTEIEYLRNVLYNYMLGKEGVVLARVIAAVCKFDPQQTENVLAKEQQKQTLLGQLGIL